MYDLDENPTAVADDTERKHRWLAELLDSLPPQIRPSAYDGRFRAAIAGAWENGWPAHTLAAQVAAVDYTRAHNPPLVAIMQIERLGERPPPRGPIPAAARTAAQAEAHCGRAACLCPHDDCFRGWIDHPDQPTRPCTTCRAALQRRLTEIPEPGKRTNADLTYLRERDDWR